MLQRYLDSPVLMSFNSNPRPITEIPFPAVTICNMNKVTTMEFYPAICNELIQSESFTVKLIH